MGDLYFTVISASYQSANRISRFNVHIHNCIAVVNCCTSTGPTDQTTCKATAGGSLDLDENFYGDQDFDMEDFDKEGFGGLDEAGNSFEEEKY